MGTRWSAVIHAPPRGFDAGSVRVALQAAVDEVDAQMSIWKADSDLMRLNRAPVGEAVPVPVMLEAVLRLGTAVGRASGGAFDMGVGDVVLAWDLGRLRRCRIRYVPRCLFAAFPPTKLLMSPTAR